MIGHLWKTVELLERKQTSLLTTIAVCTFCAAVMLTVGIHKGELRAEATKAEEKGTRTVFKPGAQFDDTGYRMFADERPGVDHPDWELRNATAHAIYLRKTLLETLQRRKASSAELDAADVEFVATVKQVNDLLVVLEDRISLEQEASIKESKDAISKDVGDSG